MTNNLIYSVKKTRILRASIYTLLFCVTFSPVKAQVEVQELPEGKSKSMTLSKVSMVKLEGIDFYNLMGKGPYTVHVDFGKNTLSIELLETSTGRLLWATYGNRKNINFVTDKRQSNKDLFVYEYNDENPYAPRKCTIKFTWTDTHAFITLFYRELDPGSGKDKRYVAAAGSM